MVIGGRKMKYKKGEKMIVEITEVKENTYVLNRIGEVESMEAKIRRQAAEITRLLAENEKLKPNYENIRAKGQNEAWELAKKINCQPINGGFKRSEFEEIFGYDYISDIFKKYTYTETAKKVAEWEKTKEKVKVGDVLEDIYNSNVKCIITNLYPNNKAYLVFDDGTAGINELDNFKKTGRHIDIDSFLKQIGDE